MNDEIHLQVWKAVTERVAETLPDCLVYRDYDPTQRLDAIQSAGLLEETSNKPLVCVLLDGGLPKKVSAGTVRDDYDFTVVLYRHIQSQGWEAKRDETDDCFRYIHAMTDAFAEKSVERNGLTLKLCRGETDGGNFYDLSYYTEMEMFCITFGLEVTHFRQLT